MHTDGIGKGKKSVPKFEVNFVVRDKSGKPTSQRKTFASNSAQDMSAFFNKHTVKNKGKGKGKRGKRGTKPSSGGNSS
jgi:hypothetical protein